MRSAKIASLVLGLLGGGCSLLLNTADPIQCKTNGDCDGNASLRGRVCSQGFCVIPTTPIVVVSNDAGSGCVSTALCTQQNSNKASVCKTAGSPCVEWQIPECQY